ISIQSQSTFRFRRCASATRPMRRLLLLGLPLVLMTRYFGIGNESVRLSAVVRNNIVPLVGRRASDKSDDRFGIAHIEDFVWHTRFYVNEMAGFVLHHLLEPGSEFVAHFSFEDIEDYLELDVNMGIRYATGRNGGNVGRQFSCADIFGGHALLIVNAVPIPAGAAATNGQYPIVIFYRAELDVVFVVFHNSDL